MPTLFELLNTALLVFLIVRVERMLKHMSEAENTLAELTTEVSEATTIMGSAATLIQGLSDRIAELLALGNPTAIVAGMKQLKTDLDTHGSALEAAVIANTPAEGEEPPPEA